MKYLEIKSKKQEMSQMFLPDGAVVLITRLTLIDEATDLAPGMLVNVRALTKGHGFTGVMKRWGFHGGPATHGSRFHRKTGSIGAGTTPGRVYKGKKMPGHFGNKLCMVKGLKVMSVDNANKSVELKGAVPGHRGSDVTILLRNA